MLAAGCQLTLVLCFIGGAYIQLFQAISDQASPEVAVAVIGFSSTTIIALPLVIVALAMVVAMVIVMVVLILSLIHI